MHYHRYDREEFILLLAEKYPQTFFPEPNLRRPLKKGIVNDLIDAGVLDKEKLIQTLDWYEQHYAYQYALLVGAERIDLAGKVAGKVTLAEQQAARRYIAQRKKEMQLQELKPLKPTVAVKVDGHANGATVVTKANPPDESAIILTGIREAIDAAASILVDKKLGAMRSVFVTAALREVIARAERVINEAPLGND